MDGIPNFWGERYDCAELPPWRKVLSKTALGAAIAVMLLIGSRLPLKSYKIYRSAPGAPVRPAKQVYPVRGEGGYLRFVTKEQAEDLDFWGRTTGPK